jgi:hypothetical protein
MRAFASKRQHFLGSVGNDCSWDGETTFDGSSQLYDFVFSTSDGVRMTHPIAVEAIPEPAQEVITLVHRELANSIICDFGIDNGWNGASIPHRPNVPKP